jgi:hypothetical protein
MSNSDTPQRILCIPGPWIDRSDLLERVIRDSDDHVFAGGVIMNMETKFMCEAQFQDTPDPGMEKAFAISDVSEGKSFSRSIASHKSVVYLVGAGGSRAAAESMMVTAGALVKAGGLGVKVETSGIGHTAARWLEFVDNLDHASAHEALVVYINGDDIRSCGMQNLGLPEAAVEPGADGASAELLKVYTRYLFKESPTIGEGQTFSVDQSAPVFRLRFEPAYDYGPDSLFNNAHGMWRLIAVSAERDEDGIGKTMLQRLRSRWMN